MMRPKRVKLGRTTEHFHVSNFGKVDRARILHEPFIPHTFNEDMGMEGVGRLPKDY